MEYKSTDHMIYQFSIGMFISKITYNALDSKFDFKNNFGISY